MLNEEQFNGKWTEIKGGVRNLWGKITDDELEKTKGNIQSVSGIVQERYGETKESIKEKLDTLMESFDNETDKSGKLNDGIASYQRNPTEVRTSSTSQNQDSREDIKTRSPERTKFDQSEGAAVNTKQGIAANQDNSDLSEENKDSSLQFGTGEEKDDEYEGEEIFDDGEKEDQTYESKNAQH